MKKNYFKIALVTGGLALSMASCTNKLDLLPTNDVTAAQVYSTPEGYKLAFAKLYGSFAMTGNNGPGTGDIQGVDVGTSDFLRLFWKLQVLPTDEAVVGWGDPGLPDLHAMNWSANNPLIKGLYYRSFYQITLCNDFIRQATDAKLAERGISGAEATAIKKYVAEARFLRAYQYWVLMDVFGKPAFVTETDAMGASLPQQASRAQLFTYIESELKAIESELAAAKTNEYGRADQAAAWALLARMYLNAQVYTGTAKNTEAITYSKKVIDAGYTLLSDYTKIMRADNHLGNTEVILSINYDGLKTQNWGGTTFFTHAAVGGSMQAADFGINGGWGGIRTTKKLPQLFPDVTGTADKRSQFHTAGQTLEINEIGSFTEGYAVTKFKNIKANGSAGSDPNHTDIDFPLFRLGEMYLVFAEAVKRGGSGGTEAQAITYLNLLRTRAYGNNSGNISSYTLDFILDERARELYWEGSRRTDLIRFDKFTSAAYTWPWKGGVKDGKAVETWRNVYPIPSDDLVSNPNLVQNPNY